jgi:HK97 gp10 family phage protein
MSTVKIKLEGDKELKRMLRKCQNKGKIQACVKRSGATLQRTAMQKAPVDTGTLKRSITLQLTDGGMTAEVQPTVHYGAYVELGTRYMSARPYLRPALETAGAELKANITRVVQSETGGK